MTWGALVQACLGNKLVSSVLKIQQYTNICCYYSPYTWGPVEPHNIVLPTISSDIYYLNKAEQVWTRAQQRTSRIIVWPGLTYI